MTLSGTQYYCVAGETFDAVALAVYGHEKYACDLMCANPELITVPMFSGGELLELPVIEMVTNDSLGEKMTDQAPWKRGK